MGSRLIILCILCSAQAKTRAPGGARYYSKQVLKVFLTPKITGSCHITTTTCMLKYCTCAGDKAAAIASVEPLATDQSGSGVQSVRAKVRAVHLLSAVF